MAGMLPGVEAARRRRFSQTNNSNHRANSSLCLYERNHVFHISSSISMRSSIGSQEEWDQNLDTLAREAKKRLDKRLKSHLKSEIKRASQGQERSPHVKEVKEILSLQAVYGWEQFYHWDPHVFIWIL